MTTVTKITRPVRRETATLSKGRPLIIELHPTFLIVRVKGLHHAGYTVHYEQLLRLGALNAARWPNDKQYQGLV